MTYEVHTRSLLGLCTGGLRGPQLSEDDPDNLEVTNSELSALQCRHGPTLAPAHGARRRGRLSDRQRHDDGDDSTEHGDGAWTYPMATTWSM